MLFLLLQHEVEGSVHSTKTKKPILFRGLNRMTLACSVCQYTPVWQQKIRQTANPSRQNSIPQQQPSPTKSMWPRGILSHSPFCTFWTGSWIWGWRVYRSRKRQIVSPCRWAAGSRWKGSRTAPCCSSPCRACRCAGVSVVPSSSSGNWKLVATREKNLLAAAS